jgi:DNA-binding transcriptional ArsR family regulator
MLETLITSKTRIKLLLKFFLNPENRAYLRNLESEFGESSNSIRLELNKLEGANMLESEMEGNKKIFKVNKKHPLFFEINSLIKKQLGITTIIENVVSRLGKLEAVYLTGDLAEGKDNNIIDLVFLGKIDNQFLMSLVIRAEERINRKIRYIVYEPKDYNLFDKESVQNLLLWNQEL